MPSLLSPPSPAVPNTAGHWDHRRKEVTALCYGRSLSAGESRGERGQARRVSLSLYTCTCEEMEGSILLLRAAKDGQSLGQDDSQHKEISSKCHHGQWLCLELLGEEKTECKGGRQQAEMCCELELSCGSLFFLHFPPVGPIHKFPPFSPSPIRRDEIASL